MNKKQYDCIRALESAGISYDDAVRLRRISMTLHRWHELECGDGDAHGSWAIARGHKKVGVGFQYDDDGVPHLEHHHYMHGKGKDYTTYTRIPDREKGAINRLLEVMNRYPSLRYYIQTDPRGAPLYILRPGDIRDGADPSSCYTNGIVVCK